MNHQSSSKRLVSALAFFALAVLFGVSAANSQTFAGTNGGLFQSSDNGSTWTFDSIASSNPLFSGNPAVFGVVVDPSNASKVYVAVKFAADAFCRTEDATKTWTCSALAGIISVDEGTRLLIDPVTTSTLYLFNNGRLLRSTDSGTRWTQLSPPGFITSVSVDPKWSGYLRAVGEKLYVSNDFGTSWFSLPFPGLSDGKIFVDPRTGNSYFFTASNICNNPDGTPIYPYRNCGLFRSDEGGITLRNLNLDGKISGFAFDRFSGDYYIGGVVTGLSVGVLASKDNGDTYSPTAANARFGSRMNLAANPYKPSSLFIFSYPNLLYLSKDRGVTWKDVTPSSICKGFTCSVSVQYVNTIAFAQQTVPSVIHLNAAGFLDGELAPSSIVSAFGSNLSTGSASAQQTPLPTSLLGTTVSIADSSGQQLQASLFFVSPNQINYLMPSGTATGPANVTVRSGTGVMLTQKIQIARTVPALFTINAGGLLAANLLRVSGTKQSYEEVFSVSSTNQIVPKLIDFGSGTDQLYLVMYGSGIRASLEGLRVTIGGTDAPVLFAGASADFPGVDQINVQIPRNLAGRGDVNVVVITAGASSYAVHLAFR